MTNTGIVTINFDNPLLLPWYMNQAAVVVLTNTTVAPTATAAAPISCGRKCKLTCETELISGNTKSEPTEKLIIKATIFKLKYSLEDDSCEGS